MSRTYRDHGPYWGASWLKWHGGRDKKPFWKPDHYSKVLAHQQFRAKCKQAIKKGLDAPTKHGNDLTYNWL